MLIFIDTSVYLSFYRLSNDDLEQLEKLATLIRNDSDVQLLVTEQVRSEYWTRRERVISEAIQNLKTIQFPKQFPRVCDQYDEYSLLRELEKQFKDAHSALLQKIAKHASENELRADQIIAKLFQEGTNVEVTPDVLARAQERMIRGKPPGKSGKNATHGDAISWEALTSFVEAGSDLHIIAQDGDFSSSLDEEQPHQFLLDEWYCKKQSSVHIYRTLNSYFLKHYPDIKLATDLEKELAIRDFTQSTSFADTHKAVAKLESFDEFHSGQLNRIFAAALNNPQIFRIITDEDVHFLLWRLMFEHQETAEDYYYKALREVLNLPPRDYTLYELPF